MDNEPMTVTIVITDSQGREETVTLGEGSHVIGRAEDCDLLTPADLKTVSRHHARLDVTPERTTIHDLQSRSGVAVNGEIVKMQVLEDGDVITVGELGLRVRLPRRDRPVESKVQVGLAFQTAKDEALDLGEVAETTKKLFNEIGKRVVGQEEVVACTWAALLSRGHCLLVGVPGLAKTLLVSTIAEILQLHFSRIQFTPDLMPSDIIGSQLLNRKPDGDLEFTFEQGPVFTQLLLADEINRAPPKTQAALLQAMQEREVTVSRNTFKLGPPFCVIATQNPIEQEGTYPLPEAQQDRFMFSMILDYPERDQEVEVLKRLAGNVWYEVESLIGYETILRHQQIVERVAVPEEVIRRTTDLVRSTRPADPLAPKLVREVIDWGAGPRGGQALIGGAKAFAAMEGRPGAVWEDVKRIVKPVLRHRIGCNYRARAQGLSPDDVIDAALERAGR